MNYLQDKTRNLLQFIILYFISRFFCLFIPGQIYDFYEDAVWASALIDQKNIYQAFSVASQGTAVLKYPPLYYPLLTLMLLAFGFYSWSIRIGFTLWEVGILFVLYYFSCAVKAKRLKKGVFGSTIDPITVLYVYAFSPVTIYNLIFGQPWFLGVFFSILGTYVFYQQKPKLTGLIFCLGFLTQLYPGFCLFPIVTFYISKKRWKDLTVLVSTFAISFIILCIPFFLSNSQLFLFNFFTHLSRIPQTTTLWELFGTLPITSLFGLFDMSILGAISLLFTGTFLILTFIKFKKNKLLTEETVIWAAIIYYLLLPALFLTLDIRYSFWAFPFLCIFLKNICLPKQRLMMGITAIGLTFSMGLLFLFTMPFLLTINQSVYYDLVTVIAILSLSMLFFLVSLPIFVYFWLVLGKSFKIYIGERYFLNLHQVISLISTIFIFQLGRFSSIWPTFLSSPFFLNVIIITTIAFGLLLILPRIYNIIKVKFPKSNDDLGIFRI